MPMVVTDEAFAYTRAGFSKEKEERNAEARYEEYTRTHKSAGLKKPKVTKPKRGRGGGRFGGGIMGMFGFGGMGYDRFVCSFLSFYTTSHTSSNTSTNTPTNTSIILL